MSEDGQEDHSVIHMHMVAKTSKSKWESQRNEDLHLREMSRSYVSTKGASWRVREIGNQGNTK